MTFKDGEIRRLEDGKLVQIQSIDSDAIYGAYFDNDLENWILTSWDIDGKHDNENLNIAPRIWS